MAKLTTKARNSLPNKDFSGPDRSYPIDTRNRAINAKARATQFASPQLKARVDAAVARKFPGLGDAVRSMKGK